MQKITGTREAFATLLSERGIYKKLGVERSTVSNWKRGVEGVDSSKCPSIDKMEEMLLKAGARVAKEKIWIIG